MPNEKGIRLPDHLAPLLQPTPSGVAKLVAAWDGLNTESQILVLTELDKVRLPAYLEEKIHIKALDSANAYVRYLAATGFHGDLIVDEIRHMADGIEDNVPIEFPFRVNERLQAVKQRIEEDPDPLVRYALLRMPHNDFNEPDAFFALPHEARLAKVRQLASSGKAMATLIAYAVDHQLKEGKVSDLQLSEILSDYVNKPSFKEHYDPDQDFSYDPYATYLHDEDIEALWRLVPKLPENMSYILIENLPPAKRGLATNIPEDVLNGMTDQQLAMLFYREDIDLRRFRKKIFFDVNEKRDEAKSTSIAHNFYLDYEEFAAILAKAKKERNTILRDLTSANDLNLCLYEAIHDVLLESGVSDEPGYSALHAFKRRLGQLKGGQRDRQLRELKLYRLARSAVPWKQGKEGYLPSGELEFLSKEIVEGDTWGTFMAFSSAWERNWHSKKLEKHLPRIIEEGDEDELGDDFFKEEAEDHQGEPTDILRQLTKDVAALRATQDRQNLLFYVVIGLLVWLLIKLF